jgi:hypothetical protein
MDQEERLLVKKAKQKDEASIVKLLRKLIPLLKRLVSIFSQNSKTSLFLLRTLNRMPQLHF